jgi:hypothetical protein
MNQKRKPTESLFRLPMRIPSRDSDRSQKAKASRKRVVFPTGINRRLSPEVFRRVLDMKTSERKRLETTWLALAGFLAVAVPGVVKGLSLEDPEVRRVRKTCRVLYKWTLTSWVHQGGDWVLDHLKSLCDWSSYYAVESDYSPPQIVPGTLGATRDGWQTFSFLRGSFLDQVRPTRGPFRVEPQEHTNFLLYEFYSLKGALPVPSQERCTNALLKHRETLTSGGETQPEILHAAERWAHWYAKKYPPKASSSKISINSAAILESSRSKGGRSVWIRDLIKKLKEKYFYIPEYLSEFKLFSVFGDYIGEPTSPFIEDIYCKVEILPGGEEALNDASKAWEEILILYLLDMAADEGFVPRPSGGAQAWPNEEDNLYMGLYLAPPEIHLEGFKPKEYPTRASVVEEQGDKARVITILGGCLSTLLHIPRTYSYTSLGKNPQIGTISGEGTLFSFMKRVNKVLKENPDISLDGLILLSLDLSRATDTFHQDLCRSLSLGFFKDSPMKVRILVPLATSPLSIEYPRKSRIEKVESTSRGIPMGNPTSWFLLNLFREFFWDLSRFLEANLRHDESFRGKKRNLRGVIKDGKLTGWSLMRMETFPSGAPTDLLTSGCGDDQISLCSLRQALIFESLLEAGGGIISPGVHFRSESFGFYTKQLCKLDRASRSLAFVDILRVRSLSSPDSRLPGKKEVPPSWSRGVAAFKELEWWKGGEYEESLYRSSCTFLFWKYSKFLKSATSYGLEVYLPQSFGGLNYPHYLREIRISGPTKRMLSILLRNDLSLDHLLKSHHLGSLFSADSESPMGRWVEEALEGLVSSAETRSFQGFPYSSPQPIYPKWWTLEAVTNEITLNFPEWKPLDVVLKDISASLYDSASYRFAGPTIQGVPSLRSISSRFKRIRKAILDSDSYRYAPLRIEDFRELEKRRDWKVKSLLVNTEMFPFLLPSLLYDG